jgi:fructoselysine-6-P-deglycase FrlB-like protein
MSKYKQPKISIDGFRSTLQEIEAQAVDLSSYYSYLKSLNLKKTAPEDCVFCGAGDSLACAKFAERLTNFRSRAFDPYDILLYPNVVKNKKVFFVSVSGKTRTNVVAAKSANQHGALETIAITANPESELARTCSRTIELKFWKAPELTPGTNSFTASLLASAMLFETPKNTDVKRLLEAARKSANSLSESMDDFPEASYHFVGSGLYYPIAMYGAAKIFELVGTQAEYQLTEEFSHLNLFSVDKKRSRIMIFPAGKKDAKSSRLCSLLKKCGFKTCIVPSFNEKIEPVWQSIFYSIILQYLALFIANKRGLERPAFLSNPVRRMVSDKMIY